MKMLTPYLILKEHFDALINVTSTNRQYSSSLEYLRDTYEEMFNTPINRVEIFKTHMRISTLPVGAIATLILPSDYDKDLEVGLIPTHETVVSVNSVGIDILESLAYKAATKENIREYSAYVYSSMLNVVRNDMFYTDDDRVTRGNPHILVTRILPLYLAFKHVESLCYTEELLEAAKNVFKDIIERDIGVEDGCADIIIDSMHGSRFTASIYDIYKIVTVNGSCMLFY